MKEKYLVILPVQFEHEETPHFAGDVVELEMEQAKGYAHALRLVKEEEK